MRPDDLLHPLATMRSVSSTRVPTGARMRMMNWLSSEGGKNSVPISGSSASALEATMARIAADQSRAR